MAAKTALPKTTEQASPPGRWPTHLSMAENLRDLEHAVEGAVGRDADLVGDLDHVLHLLHGSENAREMGTLHVGADHLPGQEVERLVGIFLSQAVEQAFRMHGSGSALPPAVASVHVPHGAFHVKAGVLTFGARSLFVAKTNGNFPGNPQRHGLPTVQGTLVVCDAERGSPIALVTAGLMALAFMGFAGLAGR